MVSSLASINRFAGRDRSSAAPRSRARGGGLRRAVSRLGISRQATATVETALVLPVLVSLVFGAIEAANGIHLKQLLGATAFDVARIATCDGGLDAEARQRGTEMLTGAGIKNATISITPGPAESVARGTDITVKVSAPLSSNLIAGSAWFPVPTVEYQVVMVRQ